MIIIASISGNNAAEEQVRKVILAGADVVRYSFASDTVEKNITNIKLCEDVIDSLNSSVKIAVNLPSYRSRIGGVKSQPIRVQEGEDILMTSVPAIDADVAGAIKTIVIDTDDLGGKAYIDQIITVDYGKIAFQIIEIINQNTIKSKALNSGLISPTHTIGLPHDANDASYLDRIRSIIAKLATVNPFYVIVPYINPSLNEELKNILEPLQARVMLRIENKFGLDNFDEICQDPFYHAFIIHRGELGDNLPFEQIGIIQKQLIRRAKEQNRLIFVSSQILEGAIFNFVPLRSDITDLTNIVLEGADGIILTSETALSSRPAYALSIARRIIIEAKKYKNIV